MSARTSHVVDGSASAASPSDSKKHRRNLEVYLHDHLAGAISALELLDHLISATDDPDRKQQFISLKQDITVDDEILKTLVASLGMEESTLKKAAAWIGEKVARLKLSLLNADEASLGLVQALEILFLGITGKLALWDSLKTIPFLKKSNPALDLRHLIARAKSQRAIVEHLRLSAAKAAFS